MPREENMDHQKDPTLSEILDEPIVVALMKRDGISRECLRQLLETVSRNLRAREERIAA